MLGLDVGTSYVIGARETDKGITYREFRDAFFRIKPATPIAAKMIEKGLKGTKYFKDSDGSFVVIDKEAIVKAVERNSSALRPLARGILSPKERDARRVFKFLLGKLLGKPKEKKEKLVYSIPAAPADVSSDDFDVGYHCDAIGNDLKELGFDPSPLNEAEAICYAELEEDDYTGVSISAGAGMQNVCVMSSGEPVLIFSLARSGDYVDRMAAASTAEPDSVVQMEKEAGDWEVGKENENRILSAVSIYYVRLIKYVVEMLSKKLNSADELPRFPSAIPVVLSGGTSLAKGYVEEFKKQLAPVDLPFEVKEVRHAKEPLRAVAKGCLIAASL